MLQLVEDEFRFYGPTVALWRFAHELLLCQVSAALRRLPHGRRKVKNLPEFRRLVPTRGDRSWHTACACHVMREW